MGVHALPSGARCRQVDDVEPMSDPLPLFRCRGSSSPHASLRGWRCSAMRPGGSRDSLWTCRDCPGLRANDAVRQAVFLLQLFTASRSQCLHTVKALQLLIRLPFLSVPMCFLFLLSVITRPCLLAYDYLQCMAAFMSFFWLHAHPHAEIAGEQQTRARSPSR